MEQVAELTLPNTLGAEKAAIEKAVDIARNMGFKEDKIEDLKTAVAEACINAIEHGNKFDENASVGVRFAVDDSSLEVTVSDNGNKIIPEQILKNRINEDGSLKRRGYGLFLISQLVNEFSFENKVGQGNNAKMRINLNN